MNPLENIPPKPIDPVERSLSKPNPFAKPGSITKTAPDKATRMRTLNWKRGRGRPRIHPKDPRNVTFF